MAGCYSVRLSRCIMPDIGTSDCGDVLEAGKSHGLLLQDATVLPSPQNGSNSNHPESSLKGQQIWRQDGTLVKPAMFPRLRGGHKQSTAIGELLRLNRQRSCRDVTRSSEFQLVVRSVEGASQADVRHMPLSRSDAAGWQLQKQRCSCPCISFLKLGSVFAQDTASDALQACMFLLDSAAQF